MAADRTTREEVLRWLDPEDHTTPGGMTPTRVLAEAARLLRDDAPAPSEEPKWAKCVVCGSSTNTDEGDGDGCQLSTGYWTCSRTCWEKAADATEPAPSPPFEEALDALIREARYHYHDDLRCSYDQYGHGSSGMSPRPCPDHRPKGSHRPGEGSLSWCGDCNTDAARAALLAAHRREVEELKSSMVCAACGALDGSDPVLVPKSDLDAARAEVERLREALGWFLNDSDPDIPGGATLGWIRKVLADRVGFTFFSMVGRYTPSATLAQGATGDSEWVPREALEDARVRIRQLVAERDAQGAPATEPEEPCATCHGERRVPYLAEVPALTDENADDPLPVSSIPCPACRPEGEGGER